MWLQNLLSTLNYPQQDAILIYVDYNIQLSEQKLQYNIRSKHIDTKFHFLGDYVKQKTMEITYCHTLD